MTYDGGDPETYAARQGFEDQTHREWELFLLSPTKKLKAFMQRWRYFGFIACVLRYQDNTWRMLKDLARLTNRHERVLDTSKLADVAQKTFLGVDPSSYISLKSRCDKAMEFFNRIETCQPTTKLQPHLS
jgi:hypothetical protein